MRDKLTIVIAILLTFILFTGLAACNDIVDGGSSEQSTTENTNTESQESTSDTATTDGITTLTTEDITSVTTESSETVEGSATEDSTETDEITTAPPCQHAYDNCDDTVCNECGFEREPVSHVFDSCEDVFCNTCNFTRDALEHIYDNCEDISCNTCNALREALDHQYDGECDPYCNLCNTFREAPSHTYSSGETCSDITCSGCGYVKVQDHSYYTTDWKPANLLGDGYKSSACSKCGDTISTVIDMISPEDIDLPIVYITDSEDTDLLNLQKADGEIVLNFKYVSNSDEIDDFECTATFKVQGASSSGYPKKNYTVKFYRDDTLLIKQKIDLGWGPESKYCMKANYVDSSQARNIVAARIFAQVVASRENINAGLEAAPNYGIIDGYPVVVYLNGTFHGLYTMNIPKDNWMVGMKKESTTRQAMMLADAHGSSISLDTPIDESFTNWELQHCSTGDDNAWVRDSFNSLIELLNCGDDERIRRELPNHLDIDAAIDNMIFTYFIDAADNTAKNIIWMTYDGRVWIPSMYDMDGTFGMWWNGQPIGATYPIENTYHTNPSISGSGHLSVPGNRAWRTIVRLYPDRVEERYIELRKEILTVENTRVQFEAFMNDIPACVYSSEYIKWDRLYYDENLSNMYRATEEQLERLDAFFLHFN